MARKIKHPNTVVLEGVDAFPENEMIIAETLRNQKRLSVDQIIHHEHYHGVLKPGCILVKTRKELTYQNHVINIYGCLKCGIDKECLRDGWEIPYLEGRHVSTLSTKPVEALVTCKCGLSIKTDTSRLLGAFRELYGEHPAGMRCKAQYGTEKTGYEYPYMSWRALNKPE